MNSQQRDLERIQRWMQSVIMHPDGAAAGVESKAARDQIDVNSRDVEQVVSRSKNLTSLERLSIYGNAYYARLLECLHEEFPALHRVLGDDAFDGFALEYLQAYPSESYTLSNLGTKLPRFLEETRPARTVDGPDWADLLIDVARLERAYAEVFDGPGVEDDQLLTADELLKIPQDRWPDVTLVPVPCLKLMTFTYPVHEYASAVRQQADAEFPEASPTYLAITRRDYIVRREQQTAEQYNLLGALCDGVPLSQAIEKSCRHIADSEDFALALGVWFRKWSVAGYFHRAELAAD